VTEGSNRFARYSFNAGDNGIGTPYFNTGFGPGESVSAVVVEYDFRYGSTAATNPPAANKHFYVRSVQFGNSFYVSWKGSNRAELAVQEAAPSWNHAANVGTPNWPIGQWNHAKLELHGDGSARYWVNGVLTHDLPARRLWPGNLTFDRVNFDAVPGGGTTQPWTLDFDNVQISRPS
jgi:hypothetical protein